MHCDLQRISKRINVTSEKEKPEFGDSGYETKASLDASNPNLAVRVIYNQHGICYVR